MPSTFNMTHLVVSGVGSWEELPEVLIWTINLVELFGLESFSSLKLNFPDGTRESSDFSLSVYFINFPATYYSASGETIPPSFALPRIAAMSSIEDPFNTLVGG